MTDDDYDDDDSDGVETNLDWQNKTRKNPGSMPETTRRMEGDAL